MSYEYVSDDEIASQVLICTGYKSVDFGYGYEIFLSKENRKDVGIKASGKFKFDPCNNPSDAWPIITSNSIAIFETAVAGGDVSWVATTNLDKSWLGYGAEGFDCCHKNPLRAAMIVFLMMQENAK